MGDYQIGRIAGIPVLVHGYPIIDASGRVRAVVFAALDLAWLNQLAASAQLPQGTTLTVIDVGGTVLARYPDPEKWIGQSVRETPMGRAVQSQLGDGTAEAPGLDGISRLFEAVRLAGAPQSSDVFVTVGIPKNIAFAEANRVQRRNLIGLGMVALLAMAAAWVGGHMFVLRPVKALMAATRQLASGDLGAPSGLSYGQGELGQLARALDDTAEALQTRQAEAERHSSEARFSSVLDIAADAIITVDEGQRILGFNRGAEHIFGYSAGEVLGRPLDLLQPPRFVEAHRHHIRAFAAAPGTSRLMGDLLRPVFGKR